MLQTGQVLGNYIIQGLLGEGGFAWVYRARHIVLESEHAIKVLRPERKADPLLRQRFLDEGRIMARLRHHHIVRVTDVLHEGEVAGLVMDFVEGGSLSDHMARATAPPPPALVRAVLLPILDALQFAHDSGVIHRDIKPDNILLETRPGGLLRPLLTDFGIARVRGELERGRARHTVAGILMGSSGYMSPEQIRGADHVDPRSDQFSLAATAFEFVTRQPPFQGESEYDIMQATILGDVVVPAELHASDPPLAAALVRALKPNPDDRFPSCLALAQALQRPSTTAPQPPPPLPPRLRGATSAPVMEPAAAPPPAPVPAEPLVVRARAPAAGAEGGDLLGMLAAGGEQGRIQLLYQPGRPEERPLSLPGPRVTIGSATGNDVCVSGDDWVGRYHCRLERGSAGEWRVRDSGTVHGTLVNGDFVLERLLSVGDRVEVGRTVLRFEGGT